VTEVDDSDPSKMLGQMALDNLCRRCDAPMPTDWPYAFCRSCINGKTPRLAGEER